VSVTYGEYARGVSLSYVDPYLFDYRIALGIDTYWREQLPNTYISYETNTIGLSPRIGLQLREDMAVQLRYSIYQQTVSLPYYLDNCNNNPSNGIAFNPSPAFANTAAGQTLIQQLIPGGVDPSGTGLWCYADGEASLPVRKELSQGATITSAIGYTFDYNTLDNNKNPTDGLLIDWKQDFAGVGGDVTYLKSAIDTKYYTPLVADIVALVHLQGGLMTQVGNNQIRMLDQFQEGPNLVRGFAPNGIGPRDINPYGTQDALGGTQYWGASLEFQMPFWFLPKELGMKGAVYADAGWLGDYKGPTEWAQTGEVNLPGCIPPTNNGAASPAAPGTCLGLQYAAQNVVRSSVGVGLIWQSPFGPLRFDYAIPITKGKYDIVQEFKFGGGTSF
jgi:outer membrane protein insertion porin family